MYSNLLKLLREIIELDNKEEELIKSSFKPYTLLKGEYFLKEGEVNKNIGFLHKGLVRYFVYKDGEESTFEFTKEGEFIGDYQSFRNASSKPTERPRKIVAASEVAAISFSRAR